MGLRVASLDCLGAEEERALAAARRAAAEKALVHQYDLQLEAMRKGFLSVVPQDALREMTWIDLQRRVCGTQNFTADDFIEWLDMTLVEAETAAILLKTIRDMSGEQRSRLLLFCSGQTRFPLPEKIKVVVGDDRGKYPTAHTCSPITLTVQPYQTVAECQKKFVVSMAHAYDFGFV